MKENGFYKISPDFINLINNTIGGKYLDTKYRPVFCCMQDKYIQGLFWGIPTSDVAHRTSSLMNKVNYFSTLDINKDIRASYYHLANTNRPAIYRISSCLPLTDNYIDSIYMSKGSQLFLKSTADIEIIRKKLRRILFDEMQHPNKYEQHITDIQDYLVTTQLLNKKLGK